MTFNGKTDEFLQLETIKGAECSFLNERIKDSLTILWNTEKDTEITIDGIQYRLPKNQLVFLTEFHNAKVTQVYQVRMIRFNRPFYCIVDHDSEVGCKGILFFGASSVPIVQIPDQEITKFETLWKMFKLEMESRDTLQIEMLQMMLKRLIILCTRLKKEQDGSNLMIHDQLDIVRSFNYLVETKFKEHHHVADYATLLHKSPKTLSNLFAKYNQKSPSQIIQNRLLLEARRLLTYTDQPISDIAYDIGFDSIQSFSRFFKKKEGISPKNFREGKNG